MVCFFLSFLSLTSLPTVHEGQSFSSEQATQHPTPSKVLHDISWDFGGGVSYIDIGFSSTCE